MAQALRSLSQAARGVAANTSDPQAQGAMLECASDVMDKANNLIEEARKAVAKPGDPNSQQCLVQVGLGPMGWLQAGGRLPGMAERQPPLSSSAGGQSGVASAEPLCELPAWAAGCGCCHSHGRRGKQEAAGGFGELSPGLRGAGRHCGGHRLCWMLSRMSPGV